MNSTQSPTLRDALRSVRESLQFANDNPGGPISDTIWMMHGPETMFDFIDAALDAAADATDQGQTETVDREIGATAARPAPIGAPDDVFMLKREIYNLKLHIERYCPDSMPAEAAPIGAVAPSGLIPKEPGEFHSYQHWVNKASSRLTSPSHKQAICIDSKNRRCFIGADFMRARDENAFPVRFFWDFEERAAAPAAPTRKDHNVRQLVNDLRAIAATFHATGQLRERISGAVHQFLAIPAPAAPIAEVTEGLFCTCVTCGLCKALNTHAAPDYAPKFDEAEFDSMVEHGTKVWSAVPDGWLEQERGNEPVEQSSDNVTISKAKLMQIARSIIAEELPDCDEEFMSARAHGVGSFHSEILSAGQQAVAVDGLAFDRRWSLARDGFGLERNDESGEYVAHTDAVEVLHAAITASAGAVDGAPSTNSAAGGEE